jgi:uncharacterized protein (DUF2235 family)
MGRMNRSVLVFRGAFLSTGHVGIINDKRFPPQPSEADRLPRR